MFFLPFRLPIYRSPSSLRVHDYTQQVRGQHYFFSLAHNEAEPGEQFYMTAYGKGVKPGDRIQLKDNGHLREYEIKAVDYYGNVPHLWTGLLVEVRE
ncbi:MAG TPA: hypothetical protein IGS37_11860 [Synechococcales cyanobacterium M55_K2018_004]|nr:hypothetical protein [Synechococcales cyanobacterium M55_K2018_004]